MTPEIWHAIYTALAFALGWTCHIGWKMLVNYHDQKKDHTISVMEREIYRLRAQIDAITTHMRPAEETAEAQIAKAPEPPRARRSETPQRKQPIAPIEVKQKSIPQSTLGRMQAQLSTFGQTRTIYAGGNKKWM